MNTNQMLEEIPAAAKYQVLNSIVCSLNCSIINAAQNVVRKVIASESDMLNTSVAEIETLFTGVDDMPGDNKGVARVSGLETARAQLRLRNYLHSQLLHEINLIHFDEKAKGRAPTALRAGEMAESIEFMQTLQSVKENVECDRLALASGISAADLKMMNDSANEEDALRNKRSAEFLKSNATGVEWVIDHVFTYGCEVHSTEKVREREVDEETGECYDDGINYEYVAPGIEDLPPHAQYTAYDKLRSALNTAAKRAFASIRRNQTFYTFSDIFMMNNIAGQCEKKVREIAEAELYA